MTSDRGSTEAIEQTHVLILALGVGLLYLLTSWFSPEIVAAIGSREPIFWFLSIHGTRDAAAYVLVRLPPLALLAGGLLYPRTRVLRCALRDTRSKLTEGFVLTVIVAWMLDAIRLWPFLWRMDGKPGLGYAAMLVEQRSILGIGLYFFVWCIVNPVLEEITFRFGALQALKKLGFKGRSVGVTSALLFTGAHLVGGLPSSEAQVVHIAGLFVFGILLAEVTLRCEGRIGVAMAIHCARNSLEFALMLISVTSFTTTQTVG